MAHFRLGVSKDLPALTLQLNRILAELNTELAIRPSGPAAVDLTALNRTVANLQAEIASLRATTNPQNVQIISGGGAGGFPLSADGDANGFKIINLALATLLGDALSFGRAGTLTDLLASRIQRSANDIGLVVINTSISFASKDFQRIQTATTGLTYTLSTVSVLPFDIVTIESTITGAIAAGPLWATSSGAIRWAGGVAPVSSNANGRWDIIRLYFDSTDWIEVSRSIGDA